MLCSPSRFSPLPPSPSVSATQSISRSERAPNTQYFGSRQEALRTKCLCISQFHLRPAPRPPSPPRYCGAFSRPGVGHLQILHNLPTSILVSRASILLVSGDPRRCPTGSKLWKREWPTSGPFPSFSHACA